MCRCLMKFAAKAGMTSLTQEWFRKSSGRCIKSHMWLIRAASRDGKVPRAVKTFRQLQKDHPAWMDPIAYNITIDACISNEVLATAETLPRGCRDCRECIWPHSAL